MALLQISEPGASPAPHARRIAVGIDLGTTHSLVAAVRNGVAECLPDADGDVIVPSVVRYLGDGRAEVGRGALARSVDDPKNTIVSVKRLMGRGLDDVHGAVRHTYDFVDDPAGMVRLSTVAGIKSPVEVSAEILATLRQRAEDTFDSMLHGAVVTVPAYFDEAQRQATKDAAQLAGLEVLRLISEPTAAAIAYGLDNASEGLYAVYDFGGGTFDISLLRMTKGVFEVIATGGDSALGGDDIDHALADSVLARAGVAAAHAGERRGAAMAARRTKEALSDKEVAVFRCRIAGRDVELPVTRDELEAVARPFVDRTIAQVRAVVRDAKAGRDEIDGIVLVGGSTRMPLVRRAVEEFFGRPPLVNLDPDQVVALGAARQADALAGNARADGLLLLDVVPLSLGIETMGGLVERIIERNSPIPTARAQTFTTFQDGQTAMAIHVVQGERELVADCRSLARFELRGIPPMVAGAARIRVTFTIDADGLLSVAAREETSGIESSVSVKPSYGLTDDEVTRMLQEGFGHAGEDMAARALREAEVEADRLLAAVDAALETDGDLLAPTERASIDAGIAALRRARGKGEPAPIEQATHDLAAATESFAARRMNRGIRRAVLGRRLEDL